MTTDLLIDIPLFASLPPGALKDLDSILDKVELDPSEILFHEGDPGDALFIVLSGSVEIVKFFGTSDARRIAIRKQGDFVGEMALLIRDGLRTATVVAQSPVSLLRISHADFDLLVRHYPELAFEMLRETSVRFWERDNATIRDLKEKNRLLNLAYEELKAAQEQIVIKETLERELRMARKIQQSILPSRLPNIAGFSFGARMEPARSVGGDFYDVFHLSKEKTGVVIGDVSDKGVPAAIFMALVRSLVRAKASPGLSPGQVLSRVNHLVCEMNAEGLFATVLFGILDQTTRVFQYGRAGHEVPLLFSPAGEILPLPVGSGKPVGLFKEVEIDEQTIDFPVGGQLWFYTDGVTDAVDDEGRLFGKDGLILTIQSCLELPSQSLCEMVWQVVDHHRGKQPQVDDVTVVVIKSIAGS